MILYNYRPLLWLFTHWKNSDFSLCKYLLRLPKESKPHSQPIWRKKSDIRTCLEYQHLQCSYMLPGTFSCLDSNVKTSGITRKCFFRFHPWWRKVRTAWQYPEELVHTACRYSGLLRFPYTVSSALGFSQVLAASCSELHTEEQCAINRHH